LPAGFPACSAPVDLDGQLRDSFPDVGADEFNASTQALARAKQPLDFSDVGPRWGVRALEH
jgi:hypothetical protein